MSGNATTPPTINQASAFVIPTTGVLSQSGLNVLLEMEQQVTTLQTQGPVFLSTLIVAGTQSVQTAIPAGTVIPLNCTFGLIEAVGGGSAGGNGNNTGGASGSSGACGARGVISAATVTGFAPLAAVTGTVGGGGIQTNNGSSYSAISGSPTIMFIAGTEVLYLPNGITGGLGGSALVAGASNVTSGIIAANGLEVYLGGQGGDGITSPGLLIGGQGGSCMLGSGGLTRFSAVNTGNGAFTSLSGIPSQCYGGGGGGATGNGTGANGGAGYLKIDWFGYV